MPQRWRFPLALFVLLQLLHMFWWLTLFPAGLSYDSVSYVWQVTTGHWSTNHSVTYSALVWLSLQLTGGVAALTFVQTLGYSAALVYAVLGLERLGVRRRWAAATAVLTAALPSMGSFASYVWKDVPFVLAMVFILGVVARLVACRWSEPDGWARAAETRRSIWLLFAGFVGMALFRENGFMMIGLALPVMALALKPIWWRTVLAGVVAMVIGIGTMNVVFPALGVARARSDLVLGTAYADISVVYRQRPGIFSQADLDLMAKVAPLSVWRDGGNCYSADALSQHPGWSIPRSGTYHSDLFALWQKLLKKQPDDVIQARICRGAIAWRIYPPSRTVVVTGFPPTTVTNRLYGWGPRIPSASVRHALVPNPPVAAVRHAGRWALIASRAVSFEPVLYRGGLWCYLAYLTVVLVSRRRREWSAVALVGPMVGNQISVLVNNPGQLSRYVTGCVYVGVLLLPLLFRSALAEPVQASEPSRPRSAAPLRSQSKDQGEK